MNTPNQFGVYKPQITDEIARCGYASAEIDLCHCDDGRYRYSIAVSYSTGGFCGPITDRDEGFISEAAAREAAIEEMLRRFPKVWDNEPVNVHRELRQLREKIEQTSRQRSLF